MTRTLVDNAGKITRLFGIIYDKEEQTKTGLTSFADALEGAANTLTTLIQPIVAQAKADLEKYFPAGIKMLFRGSAPSGWKKLADHTDYALRLTSGDTGSDAGRFSFSVRFAAGGSTTNDQISWGVNASTLSVGQLAGHSHGVYKSAPTRIIQANNWYQSGSWWGNNVGWTGSNLGHGHGTWNTAHGHSLDLNVNYVDVVLCERA
ncbi:MAG: hypothetical protein J6I57_07460 [Desulfovibrio sp.]|nr:hypothetical protein [Desulfovibrio sp.]